MLFGIDEICTTQYKKKGAKKYQEEQKNEISHEYEEKSDDEPKHVDFESGDSPPWMTSRTQVKDPWVRLHNEIVEFYRIFGPSKTQNAIRKKLFLKIKAVIKESFTDSIVKMFGSTAAMLYLPKSDIDIVVFLPHKSANSNDLKNAQKLSKYIGRVSWIKSSE